MHIWLANENRSFGGAERFTWQLGKALQKAGVSVTLVCRPHSWLAGCDLPQIHLPFSSEVDLLSRWKLSGLQPPDLVHCQAQRDLALFGGLTCWPVLKSEHSFLDSPGSAWLRRAYRRCRRVIPVSQALREQIQSLLGPLAYQVIPNAMDLPELDQPIPPKLRQGRWLGYVGGLLESKGLGLLLEQLGPLLLADPQLQLMLAGQGPWADSIKERVAQLGLQEQVWMPGHLDDPLPYLRGLEVLIQPSPRETFSLVALEAMALEVPVVSCSQGGLLEVVQHLQCGWLGPNLAEGVRYYLEHPELGRLHGQAGRSRVAAHFNWDVIIKRWLNLYRETLASSVVG